MTIEKENKNEVIDGKCRIKVTRNGPYFVSGRIPVSMWEIFHQSGAYSACLWKGESSKTAGWNTRSGIKRKTATSSTGIRTRKELIGKGLITVWSQLSKMWSRRSIWFGLQLHCLRPHMLRDSDEVQKVTDAHPEFYLVSSFFKEMSLPHLVLRGRGFHSECEKVSLAGPRGFEPY